KGVPAAAGDAMPEGADAVVPMDAAHETDGGVVAIIDAATQADNVERRGAHVKRGAPILAAGRQIGAAHIGALASTGLARICVVRRPRLCLVHVGFDVVTATDGAGAAPSSDVIHDAN